MTGASGRRRTSTPLLDEIEDYFEAAREEGKNVSSWNGHNHMTIAKVRNRFKVLPNKCGGLLAHGRVEHGDLPRADGPFEDNEMRVVDISQLTGVPQDLIVTSVISKIWELAETGNLGVDKLIIFVDELNKYAPSGNSRTSSLKDTLVDISARGRHLSLTLFGAQQFRSKVEDEVIGNAATSLYGRIGDEELTNASYRSFSGTTREELLQLEKGRLLLRHAHYAVPVFGRFPRPPVLMGKQGTDIFGEQKQDPASSVLAVMRNLTARPPGHSRHPHRDRGRPRGAGLRGPGRRAGCPPHRPRRRRPLQELPLEPQTSREDRLGPPRRLQDTLWPGSDEGLDPCEHRRPDVLDMVRELMVSDELPVTMSETASRQDITATPGASHRSTVLRQDEYDADARAIYDCP